MPGTARGVELAKKKLSIASAFVQKGRLGDAENLYRNCIASLQAEMGEDFELAMMCEGLLGQVLLLAERLSDAEQCLDALHKRQCRVLGPKHPHTVVTSGNLATVYRKQGQVSRAEESMKACIAVADSSPSMGEASPEGLASRSNLGQLYLSTGKPWLAQPLISHVFEQRQAQLGAGHPLTLKALNDLGNVYCGLGQFEEAKQLLSVCLQVRRNTFGDGHQDTLRCAHDLAQAMVGQGAHEHAVAVLEECFAKHQSIAAEKADSNNAQGRQNQTAEALMESLSVAPQPATENGDTNDEYLTLEGLQSMHALGVSFAALDRVGEGIALIRRCCAERKRRVGELHPDTLQARSSLGACLRLISGDRAAQDEALNILEDTYRKQCSVLGEESYDTLATQATLAALQLAKLSCSESMPRENREECTSEVLDMFNSCFTKCQQLLGPSHPLTFSVRAGRMRASYVFGNEWEGSQQKIDCREEWSSLLLESAMELGPEHREVLGWATWYEEMFGEPFDIAGGLEQVQAARGNSAEQSSDGEGRDSPDSCTDCDAGKGNRA